MNRWVLCFKEYKHSPKISPMIFLKTSLILSRKLDIQKMKQFTFKMIPIGMIYPFITSWAEVSNYIFALEYLNLKWKSWKINNNLVFMVLYQALIDNHQHNALNIHVFINWLVMISSLYLMNFRKIKNNFIKLDVRYCFKQNIRFWVWNVALVNLNSI